MYDGGSIDRANGVFAVWDPDKASEFLAKPGGVAHGYFPKGSKMPVLASYRWPTSGDGKRNEEWHGCIPGLGFQLGAYRWESGLVWLVFRRVRWPAVEGREPWLPSTPSAWARLRAWVGHLRRQPATAMQSKPRRDVALVAKN